MVRVFRSIRYLILDSTPDNTTRSIPIFGFFNEITLFSKYIPNRLMENNTKLLSVVIICIFLVGCTDGNVDPPVPDKWIEELEKVDSGNRDLEERIRNIDEVYILERTVSISHESTNMYKDSVSIQYELRVTNNEVPRSSPLGTGRIKPNSFVLEFYTGSGYGSKNIGYIPIKAGDRDGNLEVNKAYEGILSMNGDAVKDIKSESGDGKLNMRIIHIMAYETRVIYDLSI